MPLSFEPYEPFGYSADIPNCLLTEFEQCVRVWDDPILEEVEGHGRCETLTIVIETDDDISPAQLAAAEWVASHGELISERAERFLRQKAESELRPMLSEPKNAGLVAKYGLDDDLYYRKMYGLIWVTVYEASPAGQVPYSLDISDPDDEEHGLSLLFVGERLVASGQDDFHNRGDSVLGHVRAIHAQDGCDPLGDAVGPVQ